MASIDAWGSCQKDKRYGYLKWILKENESFEKCLESDHKKRQGLALPRKLTIFLQHSQAFFRQLPGPVLLYQR